MQRLRQRFRNGTLAEFGKEDVAKPVEEIVPVVPEVSAEESQA